MGGLEAGSTVAGAHLDIDVDVDINVGIDISNNVDVDGDGADSPGPSDARCATVPYAVHLAVAQGIRLGQLGARGAATATAGGRAAATYCTTRVCSSILPAAAQPFEEGAVGAGRGGCEDGGAAVEHESN